MTTTVTIRNHACSFDELAISVSEFIERCSACERGTPPSARFWTVRWVDGKGQHRTRAVCGGCAGMEIPRPQGAVTPEVARYSAAMDARGFAARDYYEGVSPGYLRDADEVRRALPYLRRDMRLQSNEEVALRFEALAARLWAASVAEGDALAAVLPQVDPSTRWVMEFIMQSSLRQAARERSRAAGIVALVRAAS